MALLFVMVVPDAVLYCGVVLDILSTCPLDITMDTCHEAPAHVGQTESVVADNRSHKQ